LAKQQLRN